MPRLKDTTLPTYCRHRGSGQARVTLNGVTFYLGRYGTRESRHAYDRRIAEWISNGRHVGIPEEPITVAEVYDQFREHARSYYGQESRTPEQPADREATPFPLSRRVGKILPQGRRIRHGKARDVRQQHPAAMEQAPVPFHSPGAYCLRARPDRQSEGTQRLINDIAKVKVKRMHAARDRWKRGHQLLCAALGDLQSTNRGGSEHLESILRGPFDLDTAYETVTVVAKNGVEPSGV